ncbi:MAG: alpha/beta hydrolase [Coleofasciculaceae cyanobacterium]
MSTGKLRKLSNRLPSSVVGRLVAIAIGLLSGMGEAAQAAQTVVVKQGNTSQSIELSQLKTIAEMGTVPQRWQDDYAKLLSPEQQSQIISALQTKFELDVVQLRDFLNTQMGNELVSVLARATSRRDRVGLQSLKTALIRGARAPEGFSLLSLIEAYPGRRLNINLDQAFQVVGNFNKSFWQTQSFLAAISPQLTPKHPTLNLPFDPTQTGSTKVQVLNLYLNDQERQREIPVDVYLPQKTSLTQPLVVLSHGLGSVRTDLRYLAEHLASYGYVVAALEHPGSNATHLQEVTSLEAPLLAAEEFIDRPLDISFVLDQLERLNQETAPFRGKLATDQVLVIGYSFGGSTALSLAGAELQLTELRERCSGNISTFNLGEISQCFAKDLPEDSYQLGDKRVKAAIALNPTTSLIFGKTGLNKLAVPTLMAASSADKTAPALREQVIGFEQMPSPKWLVGFVGATHLSVKDPSTTLDQAGQPNTVYSGGEVVGEQAVEIRSYVKAIALAMAAQLTDQAAEYEIFLKPEYAQLASTDRFMIRLVTEIPEEVRVIVQDFVQNHPD